ncbi:efflux RND transporter periplasmic adaptor subunit [candidate division KSB1 bacterium]
MNRRKNIFKASLLLLPLLACAAKQEDTVELYTVSRGDFINTITVTGELEAVNSEMISTPFLSWHQAGMPKIIEIVDDGERVEKGDILVQFDTAEIEKTILDAETELEIAEAEVAKAIATQKSEVEELTADLEIAGLNHKISQLELEQATFEAVIKRREIELNLEKSAIALQRASEEIGNRQRVHRQELSRLELKRDQAKTKLSQAQETLASLTISAPSPGIAIIRENRTTDAKFQVGDQSHPGRPLIGLPDLDNMKAEVMINEVDIAKVDTAQRVVVRLDAYPDTSFKGRVKEIGTLARSKTRNSKVKVFDVEVLLEDSDERLIPGMTVSSEIEVSRLPDTLFVPLEALFAKENRNVVYVLNGAGYEEREVSTGDESGNYVIVAEGIKEGDKVALRDPTILPAEDLSAETATADEEQ